MSLHKQIDFARFCGISRSSVSVNIRRGNIVVGDDKMIDDSHPINKNFMDRMVSKSGNEEKIKNTKSVSVNKVSKKPKELSKKDLLELEKEKKALDIEKIQEEIELLKKKNAKLEGENIPTKVVIAAFSQHFKSVTTAFKNASNRLVSEISKKKGLSKTEQADLTGKLYSFINQAVTEAKEDSKASIELIVQDHSEKRSVGERK